MQKEINVIKIVLVSFFLVASCVSKSKTDHSIDFLEYYFSENYDESKIINLKKDNSNEANSNANKNIKRNPGINERMLRD